MNKHIVKYRREIKRKLKTMRSKDPKQFWKILNNGSTVNNPNISIGSLFDFFKNLNKKPEPDPLLVDHRDGNDIDVAQLNHELNNYITKDEIEKCIKSLYNNKAHADDAIINEYIKSTSNIFMPVYEKLFNIIFNTGIIPEYWLLGNIKPIYKNKGDKQDPKNYRPITILSCMGKLFTALLNNRLNKFSDDFRIIKENQAGFRKHYSTADNIFVIHILFEILKTYKKKLFCAFIDFEKAFDTVWREGLWHKLILNNINGKMFNIIVNMYQNIKSRIIYNGNTTDFFKCENGVRQGENLSPFLFSVFLNDITDFFNDKNIDGLTSVSDKLHQELDVYIKLFVLLYADDTVLMAENANDLQKQLNIFKQYCDTWKLKVNVDKSNVLIFSSGRTPKNLRFLYDGKQLDIVDKFNYLGITFTKSGSFLNAKKDRVSKGTQAMYSVLKKGRLNNLSIECQLDLFDKIVKPVLLYGCEIWGYGNNNIIEKVHLKFCKLLLHLKPSTPDFMVYGELGRFPLDINIKTQSISYWSKLIAGNENKLSNTLYKLCMISSENADRDIKWIRNIKTILDSCGLSNIWLHQTFPSDKWLKLKVKQTLFDQFTQEWRSKLQNSPKALNYRLYKEKLEFEPYLNILTDKDAITFCKFRTCNHHLPIEKGRWQNIPREHRTCPLCQKQDLGDEFHYMLNCSFFTDARKSLLPTKFVRRPNILQFNNLMSCKKQSSLRKICTFIRKVNNELPV